MNTASYKDINIFGDYLLSFIAIGQSFLLMLQIFLGDSGIVSLSTANSMRIVLSAFPILIGLYFILKRKLILTFLLYLFSVFLLILSVLISPLNMDYIFSDGLKLFLFTNIPIFLSLTAIIDKKIFFSVALDIAYISTFLGLIYFFLFFSGQLKNSTFYNMSFSYSLLIPALIFFWKRTNFYYLLGFLNLFMMLLLGSRGPVVAVLFYYTLQSLFFAKYKDKLFLVYIISFIIIMIPFIYEYITSIGLSSRTLALLLKGEISQDSGRSEIYTHILDKLFTSPLIGYGLFGDRPFLNGGYCHNIFLEIIFNFGIFIGGLIIFSLIVSILKIFFSVNKESKLIILLFFFGAIIPLLVSGSYLIDFKFPLFIGILYWYSQ